MPQQLRRLPIVPGGGKVRRGGCTKGDPDNVIGSVGGGDIVTVLVQCAGEDVGDQNEPQNFWWMLIETGETSVGWVSAVLIDEGATTSRSTTSRPPRRCSPCRRT